MKIPSTILTLILGISLTLISLWYGQHHGLLPVAASKDATQIDDIFNLMMTIATGLFLLIEGVLLFCVISFRRRKGDRTDGPAIEGNVPLEILWTAIPTVIVFILAIYSFEIYNNIGGLDPATSANTSTAVPQVAGDSTNKTPMLAMSSHHHHLALGIGPSFEEGSGIPPLVVNVRGIQYAWIFSYPETGITSGELHVPLNRPVRLNISAGDVIHSFWVPELRLKQDAIPGRETVLAFTANRAGKYPVICAELCGAYHGGMKTFFYAHTEDEYNQWIQENTIAEQDSPNQTVASNPQTLSQGGYLAPYAAQMGIDRETIAQLHPMHLH